MDRKTYDEMYLAQCAIPKRPVAIGVTHRGTHDVTTFEIAFAAPALHLGNADWTDSGPPVLEGASVLLTMTSEEGKPAPQLMVHENDVKALIELLRDGLKATRKHKARVKRSIANGDRFEKVAKPMFADDADSNGTAH